MNEEIPHGFTRWKATSNFVQKLADISSLYFHEETGVLAVRVCEEHSNSYDIAHGGMLVTLADCALGHAISKACPASAVTAQLSVEFLRPARSGDWLEAHVQIEKVGRQLVNATCRLRVAERTVLKASTVFCVVASQAI
jgi:uncharacterized protein (TIGR00369 family)